MSSYTIYLREYIDSKGLAASTGKVEEVKERLNYTTEKLNGSKAKE